MNAKDVYRDEQGNPVTITEEQMYAIWHAINIVQEVRRAEDCRPIGENNWHADLYKSRLLGRMLLQGKPPLEHAPPNEHAGGWYSLIEDGHAGLPDSFVWSDEDRAVICGFPWRIVERVGADLIVSYRDSNERWRLTRDVPADCPPCWKGLGGRSEVACDWWLVRESR